jgi:hypothetical protein
MIREDILEINDTASGFAPANQEADMKHVLQVALERMQQSAA